jgi:tetratricopeptide (TPR) repeat protein
VIAWIAYKSYKSNRLVSFAVIWFFVNLLPLSNIVPINSFLAEHWIYMASVGPFLLVGMGAVWAYKNIFSRGVILRVIFIVLLAALFGLYSGGTVIRNMAWENEITFFTESLKYHPRNSRLYLNLGNTYYENKETDKAIEQYQKALEIDKNYAVAYGNIGSAYLHKRDPEKAEKYLVKAINLKYNYPIAHYNLGVVYLQKEQYINALKEFRTATEQLPQFYQAWNMMGRTQLKLRDVKGARSSFERSLEIMPTQEKVHNLLKKLPK